jgi:hypothetical protein
MLDHALDPNQFSRQNLAVAQLSQCRVTGFCFRHAVNQQLLVSVFEVLRQFLGDFRFARWCEFQSREPFPDFFLPLRHARPP